MAKIVQINQCPNCGGQLEESEWANLLHCPYCNSDFEIEESGLTEREQEKKKKENENGFTKKEWFDYRVPYKKLLKGPDSRTTLKAFCHCTNELGTSEAILDYIDRTLIGRVGLYCKKHREEKLNAFLGRIGKDRLDADEKILFYANNGLFSSGKHGYLFTDKKVIFSARSPYTVYYTDIEKIAFGTDDDFVGIYLNSSRDTQIYNIEGGNFNVHGAVAALCCAFAFEKEPDRNKIIIEKFDDENL